MKKEFPDHPVLPEGEGFERRDETATLDEFLLIKEQQLSARLARMQETCNAAQAKNKPEAERARTKVNRLGTRLKQIAQYATLATAAGLTGHYATHELSRYDVTESTDEQGKKTFSHEDPQTTAMIEYLSGKAELPDEVQLAILKIELKNQLHSTADFSDGTVTAGDIDAATMDTIDQVHTRMCGPSEIGATILDAIFDKPAYNEELYNALWDIERESGNPKIRFTEQGSPVIRMKRLLRPNRSGREGAIYNPLTNTMYINAPYFFDAESKGQYLAEAAHGKQWNEAPLATTGRHIGSLVTTAIEMIRSRQDPSEAYDKLYETPGTVEHEAHSIIEKQFEKRLPEEDSETKRPGL